MSNVKTFIKSISSSIVSVSLEDIVRALCTLGSLGACIYLYIARGSVPSELLGLTTLFVGYFFGRVQSVMSGKPAMSIGLNRKDE